MAVKEWTTNYPGAQDTGVGGADQQEDLINTQDDTRISQILTLRDKLQGAALKVGDDNDLPSGCLGERVTTIEGLSAPRFLLGEKAAYLTDDYIYPIGGDATVFETYAARDSNAPFATVRFIVSAWITTAYSDSYDLWFHFGAASFNLTGLLNTSEAVTKYDLDVSAVPLDTQVRMAVETNLAGGVSHVNMAQAWAIMPW